MRICVSSGQRGGVGKSTIAIVSSSVLSRLSDVLLLDLSFSAPTSSSMLLNSRDGLCLSDYIYGRASVKDVVEKVGRGLYVARLKPSVELPPRSYAKFAPLLNGFTYVLVDFPAFSPGYNIYTLILYRLCDRAVLVGDLDLLSVRALEPLAKSLEDKIIVLNKYAKLFDPGGRIEKEYRRLGELHKIPEDNVLRATRILLENPLAVPSPGVIGMVKLALKAARKRIGSGV